PPSYHERRSRQVTQAATIARLEAELKAERDKCVERRRYREQAVTTQGQLMEQAKQIAKLT
ncbi:unnamed protein product, partial [Effrenium voratum]